MPRIARILALVLLVSMILVGCGGQPPEAQFEASPTTGYVPIDVEFTDLSEGDVNSWEWDFDNDGIVDSTDQNPGYTYSTYGNYTISLAVRGPDGTDTETKSAYLQLAAPPCTADFVAEPTICEGVTEVQFTDQSTGAITGWAWDFKDDGEVDSHEQNPTYTYRSNGRYSVTLTVTAPECEDSLTRTDYIEVTGCPT